MYGCRQVLATLVTDDCINSLRFHRRLHICEPLVFNPFLPEAVTELDERHSAPFERSVGFGHCPFGIFS